MKCILWDHQILPTNLLKNRRIFLILTKKDLGKVFLTMNILNTEI